MIYVNYSSNLGIEDRFRSDNKGEPLITDRICELWIDYQLFIEFRNLM